MKINVPGEKLLFSNYETTNNIYKTSQNISSNEVDIRPIKVTISEEGKKACKINMQGGEKNSYESMVKRKTELIEQKIAPEIDYCFMLGNKLADIKERDNGYHSLEDKGAAILEAYASAYDEIMQGYEQGTRNIYVEDKTAESGYRKVTMEEEVDGLNDAYQKYISGFEAQMEQASEVSAALEMYRKDLVNLDAHRAAMIAKAQERYDKMSKENITENVMDSMLGAKQKFIELYSRHNKSGLSVRSLLENIKIFS